MFYCTVTNRLSKPGEKPFKVVTEKRERIYTRKYRDEDGFPHEEIVAKGHEIVKEVLMTKEGYDLWIKDNPNGAIFINK